MAKRILIILGTARRQNTNTLVEAFARGATEAGHLVETISIGSKLIHGCFGCDACRTYDAPCVQNDDMTPLYAKVEAADVLVFASPIYYGSLTSQTKAFIDRLYCYGNPAKKESALLLTAGGGGGKNTDSAVSTYFMAAEYLNLEDKGTLLAEHVSSEEDVLAHPAYEEAYLFGKSIGA
ncbi:MAG: flavodoxin family protein [Christensenellaceae bacterium]